MRTVLLLCAIALSGCAEPPAPVVEEPVTVAVQEPPLHPRMTEEERERYVNCTNPLLRALARREIDVGTRIEVVLARFPKFFVTRHDPFVTLEEAECVLHSGLTLIAKNGKLVTAYHSGCHHHVVFFDECTEADRVVCDAGFIAARAEQNGFVAPLPRAKP